MSSNTPVNSKRKGAAFEREVARIMRVAGFDAMRGVQYRGGGDSPDVVHNIPEVHIECKHRVGIDLGTKALHSAMWQALNEAPAGHKAVVVWRKSGARQINVTWETVIDGTPTWMTADFDEWLRYARSNEWR